MKLAKKITSIVSAAAMLASVAALNVDAAGKNRYSVSYETLTQAVETSDGTVIPAGAVAVSIAISGNTGFVADTLTLDVEDGYTAVTNSDGTPFVEAGSALNFGLAAAAFSSENDIMCVSVASAFESTTDGDVATVYFLPDDSTAHDGFAALRSNVIYSDSMASCDNILPNSTVIDYYAIGDATGDMVVNAVDASTILYAVYEHQMGFYFGTPSGSPETVYEYFPNVKYYVAPDANTNNCIDNFDASDILEYTSLVGLGPGHYEGNIGTLIPFLVEE